MDPLTLFAVLLKDSALTLGGFGSLPLLRQDLVATGLATDTQIVQALAIGRLSTGPNGLWIVSLGYQLAGLAGALMALVAACLPPLAIRPATALARRWLLSVPFAGLVRGAALAQQDEGGRGEVIDTEGVIEAGVRGARIDQVREAEMPDVPEPLEGGGVDDACRGRV